MTRDTYTPFNLPGPHVSVLDSLHKNRWKIHHTQIYSHTHKVGGPQLAHAHDDHNHSQYPAPADQGISRNLYLSMKDRITAYPRSNAQYSARGTELLGGERYGNKLNNELRMR